MITIAIDPNVRVGLGRYDEGERASERAEQGADFCTWLHSFIRKWPRVKFKDGRAGSEIRKRRRIRQLTLLGEWDNHSSANLMLPTLS